VLGQLTTATRSVHGCPSPHGAAERLGRERVEDDAARQPHENQSWWKTVVAAWAGYAVRTGYLE
jgi:hypothetical protein